MPDIKLNKSSKIGINYVILSISTTGIDKKCKITELAALKIENHKIIDHFHSFVRVENKKYMPDGYYYRYSYDFLLKYPYLQALIPKFTDFLGNDMLVGWCIDFDIARLFKQAKYYPYRHEIVDIFDLEYPYFKKKLDYCSLEAIYSNSFGKPANYDYECAMDQCYAIFELAEGRTL